MKCPNLPYITHLILNTAPSYTNGAILKFHCESGYSLVGSDVIMCQKAGKTACSILYIYIYIIIGQWNTTLPSCVISSPSTGAQTRKYQVVH